MVALKSAAEIRRAGRLFAIYPQGTRSLDGDLHAGHTGAAYLSMATGAPIVPTGIVGTSRVREPPPSSTLITDDVMSAIHALSGQSHTEPPAGRGLVSSGSIGVGDR